MARRIFYPLYQLGNPPTRIFRTDYFLTLVRPGIPLPEDTVQFRIPMDMTRIELKDYLEKIYNVPVAAVRTRIQYGSNKQRDDKNRRIKKPDYKVAYVQLMGKLESKALGYSYCYFLGVPGRPFFLRLRDILVTKDEAAGQTFQFPDLFPDTNKAPEPGSYEEIEKKVNEEKRQKQINDPRRGDVPNWFWH